MALKKNPAILISLIAAVLALAISLGVRISQTQSEAILNLAEVLIPLLIGSAGVVIRSFVYSPESVQTALNMPANAPLALLDQVIETGVEVLPGDTKSDIVAAVSRAEIAQL